MKRGFAAFVLLAAAAAAQLRPGTPSSVGMSESRLGRAAGLLDAEVKAGHAGAASIIVARRSQIVLHKGYGKLSAAAGAPAVQPDSIYLLASITKPVTVTALMKLVERGLVSLSDPVSRYLPDFSGGERDRVRVRDILSHTSGLPDMLPENIELRRAQSPLSEFVRRTYETPLLYRPREGFLYQSMGILLAGEIVEKVTGMRLREFEQKEIFGPLGMRNSALGMKPGWKIENTVQCYESPCSNPEDLKLFGANTPYWRDIGHPWGGMHSTTTDLAILLQTFLNGGTYGGARLLSPPTVEAMTTNQNGHLDRPWGLGWALAHSTAWNYGGELVSPRTFGHAAATGTVAWADPERQLLCVILTNWPISDGGGRLLRLVSNTVVASVED